MKYDTDLKAETLESIALEMMVAARTAPKVRIKREAIPSMLIL